MSSIDAVSCGVLSFGSVHLRLRTGGQLIAKVHQSKLGWVRIGTCFAPGENRASGSPSYVWKVLRADLR